MARHKNTEEVVAPIPEQEDNNGATIETSLDPDQSVTENKQEDAITPEQERDSKTVTKTDVQPDQQNNEGAEDLKDETVTIPEQADVLLKIFNQYPYLYIDSIGGVYTGPHDKAVKYINP